MSQIPASIFHPTKILVPTDFSASSVVALATASEIASRFAAEVYLLHAIPMFPVTSGMEFPTTFYPRQEFLTESEADATKKLIEFVAELASAGVKARFTVDVGSDVVGTILRTIDKEGIDLLIVSTHGMSGWRPVVFGSIAEKVIKLAECSVLLLRSAKTVEKAA